MSPSLLRVFTWTLLMLLLILLVSMPEVSSDVQDCVRWCNGEYKRCVDLVAQTMPLDDSDYSECHKDWEQCEETCHMD